MVEIKQLIVKSNVIPGGRTEATGQALSPEAREELLNELVAECRTLIVDLLKDLKGR